MRKKSRKYILSDIFPKITFEELAHVKEDMEAEKNMAIIDEKLEDLKDFLKEYYDKNLTEYEESRVLEIVDEYTPKKKDGNYLVDLLPFEYAWEIYEAEKEAGWERFSNEWRKIAKK